MNIKNLTIGKLKEICLTYERCAECPLNGKGLCSIAYSLRYIQTLEEEIFLKQPKRKYYVKFTKYDVYGGNKGKEMRYQNNCGFCVGSLRSYSIKRPFDSEDTVVENLVVKDMETNKIIYQGNNYQEYLDTIMENRE